MFVTSSKSSTMVGDEAPVPSWRQTFRAAAVSATSCARRIRSFDVMRLPSTAQTRAMAPPSQRPCGHRIQARSPERSGSGAESQDPANSKERRLSPAEGRSEKSPAVNAGPRKRVHLWPPAS